MTTSISEIRKDFPLLMSNDVIYLDTAATSQKPSCVLEAERTFYEKYNAWRNHAMHGNCIKLCNTMDLYCKKILESE